MIEFLKRIFGTSSRKSIVFNSQSRSKNDSETSFDLDTKAFNMYMDMIEFQDTLLDIMKIPSNVHEMQPYQKKVYDIVEQRKDRIFEKMNKGLNL